MDLSKIKGILDEALKQRASDIHFLAGHPPYLRVFGELNPMPSPPLNETELNDLILGMLSPEQRDTLKKAKELDFSYRSHENYQFRVNVCYGEGALAANIRIMAAEISSMEKLALPPVINELCTKRRGLIIISGTAGSGKTTTLTYMVDLINRTRKCKIITIEDPIEYYHKSQKSVVLQREVGSDTNSFNDALKYALRQDPDVLVIGEMRDLDSIAMAITSAETGHLVLTTVHASDAIETINRIIDVFPMDRRQQILAQLAGNLLAVISQCLVPLKAGEGRALATEIMCMTVAIQNLVNRDAFTEIRAQIDSDPQGKGHTLERCLAEMIRKDTITKQAASQYTKQAHALDYFIKTGASTSADTMSKDEWEALYNRSIFIIDRDQQERAHVEAKLRAKGFKKVGGYGKNKESIELVRRQQPELVIFDLNYEFLTTLEYCRQLRATGHKFKLILMAEFLQANDESTAQSVGADGYVVKTNECELLIKSITKLNFKVDTTPQAG
ncbi:MAG: PilT/PilU family type 4a pilus ATPase [Candidatus Omnitrophica bacterium]|nr:PilT/PilU family type 4a pilus ATPase [Candidatus Omnitrophota bacterium]